MSSMEAGVVFRCAGRGTMKPKFECIRVHESQSMRITSVWVVLAVLILVGGCQSGPSSVTGGYTSEREDFNIFGIRYSAGKSVSMQKASDLALMRAAELTLENGFEYLAVVASENETDSLRGPVAGLAIGCFRKEPKHIRSAYDVYKAADVFEEMAMKYEIKRGGQPIQPRRGAFKPAPDSIQFSIAPWYTGQPLAVDDVEYIVRGTSGFDMDGTWVGRYTDLENPVESIDDFIEAAKPIAAQYGSNAIVVEDDPARIHGTARFNDIEEVLIGFVADLYVVPTASLGIEWEPGDMMLGKYIIRRFRPGSRCADAGLKLGDKVLAVNGIDVLETNAMLQQTMQWSVDEKATLAVVRNGEEIQIEVPLVPNMIVAR